jgi:hypothetical protein
MHHVPTETSEVASNDTLATSLNLLRDRPQ